MKKKILSILLVLVCLVSVLSLPVYAADDPDDEGIITPYWTNIASISNTITVSGSSAECSYYIRAYTNVAKITVNSTLERYINGDWSSVYPHSKTYNTFYGMYNFTVSINSSYSHRLNSTFRVYDASGKLLETVNRISYP